MTEISVVQSGVLLREKMLTFSETCPFLIYDMKETFTVEVYIVV